MPLKYIFDQPEAVRVVGLIRGLLALFFFAVGHVWSARRWPFTRVLHALVASVIPFGAFVLEARLRREEQLSYSSTTVSARGRGPFSEL